ncbi:MAG: hypothetical protein H6718_20610 [Polyangiaceae bacterium]|nr:hypothetical protein [Myxococcales bacterium]MCB9587818.1 hypothetical protein [Polyangiaceae bacterium]MCB9608767.1 hypothetical protein [Polyangiaceae bacterium]
MLPAPTRRDLRTAATRAETLAAQFELAARIDDEVPSTWHLGGEYAGRQIAIAMGSPRLRRWGAGAVTHWLHLTVHEATWLPNGAALRPASRNVWQWREGLPGETPHLRVRHPQLGLLEYMLLPESLHPDQLGLAERTLKSLPGDISWLSAQHKQWEVRVSQLDEATPLAELLLRLLEWQGLKPLSS